MTATTTWTVSVTDARDDAAAAIQAAVDAAHQAGGGVVEVERGTHTLNRAIRMRSGVHLVGESGTVLTRRPSIEVPVRDFLGYGHYELSVTEPGLLNIGDDIIVLDSNAGGFYTTVARIVGRRDGMFFIDRFFNHDYLPQRSARVQTVFSHIDATGCQDIAIRNLVLDGNENEPRIINGCRGGAIFAIMTHRMTIENVEVRHFEGDCISYQQCTDVVVTGCHIHDNSGNGLHPGSGSVRWVMSENRVENNGKSGLFYCLRTTHGICRDNTFAHNGEHGISIGERDGHHLIENNRIENNGHSGVVFRIDQVRGGEVTVLRNNTIRQNMHSSAPNSEGPVTPAEVHVKAGLKHVLIQGNAIEPRQGVDAINVEPGCEAVHVVGNRIASGNVGQKGAFDETAPASPLPIGPSALPLDGARHLGIEKLEAWQEH